MYPEVRNRLKFSFEAAIVDLKKLVIEMEDDHFEFGKDYRTFEYLQIIMKDEMAAVVDELSCAVERRDWADVEVNLSEFNNLYNSLEQAYHMVVGGNRKVPNKL